GSVVPGLVVHRVGDQAGGGLVIGDVHGVAHRDIGEETQRRIGGDGDRLAAGLVGDREGRVADRGHQAGGVLFDILDVLGGQRPVRVAEVGDVDRVADE